MHDFHYKAPTTLAEAMALHAQSGGGARFLAGGTDLYLAMEHGKAPITCVIDLKQVPGLTDIDLTPTKGGTLGCLVTMAELENHPQIQSQWKALAEAAAVVGGPPVRNRATLGGNLCNASPAADTSVPLLAMNARVVIDTATGEEREIPLAQLWEGPRRTTLKGGEILRTVHLPQLPANTGTAFQRITRSAMDIALVNGAARVTLAENGNLQEIVIALGAVAPTVILVPGLDTLQGKACDQDTLDLVAKIARETATPISDHRASADYRRDMAGVVAQRAVETAFMRAKENQESSP